MNWFRQHRKIWVGCGLLVAGAIPWASHVASIVGPFMPYAMPPKSQDGVNPALLGNWYEEFEYPDRDCVVRFKGTIQYFSNKTYRLTGEMQSVSTKPGTPFKAVYAFDGNGEWQATDDELVIKLAHVQAPLTSTTLGNRTVSAEALNAFGTMPGMDIGPKLELAQSQRYDIRSTSKDKVVLETNGIYGDTFQIAMLRTQSMYLR
ncbi:hypothetical protein [Pseudomonas tolaasii]|uniref:hypothetical protein n=1 Tax=Pseudomonas tolaasii TaxID=29442 RepID=UPI0027357A25|nr:hypothetical protein [Pseudomonas tolaasii]WLH51296.1 hypothetical protein PSH62_24980 [Pseudomonas tolaasii]